MSERPLAIVTGGTRGIGLGIARKLEEIGYRLVLAGRRTAREVQPVLDSLPGAAYVMTDISVAGDRERLVASTEGRIDLLVNNAGMAPRIRADILDATEESFLEVMAVNLLGPYFLTQLAARRMIQQAPDATGRRGCVVNITSVSAIAASVNRGEYCLSKAGLSMATRLWALRLAEYGIPVYEVRPGIIRTDMTASVAEKYDRLIEEGLVPQSRWGSPEDVGKAVAVLASGSLPYSTGSVIPVDGGMLLPRL